MVDHPTINRALYILSVALITAGIVIADAAARANVPHLVFSSVGGAERDSGVPHFESKRRVEEHIEALGIRHTFLRPVLFMDNLSGFMTSVEDGQVVVRMALPDGIPLQMVAVRDIGRAAAAILRAPEEHRGATYELTGPEALTFDEIAAVLTAAGRPAVFVDETLQEARASRRRWNAPEWQLDAWISTYTAVAAGEMQHVSGDVRLRLQGGRATVTGRRSEQSLYDFDLATSDTGDAFDQSVSRGFIELWSLPSKISARRDAAN